LGVAKKRGRPFREGEEMRGYEKNGRKKKIEFRNSTSGKKRLLVLVRF